MDARRRHTRSGPTSKCPTPPPAGHKDFAQLVRLTPAFGPPPSPCQEVLKPVLISLGLVGVFVQRARRRRSNTHHQLWCLLVFLYLLMNVALNFTQMALKNGRTNVLDTIAGLMASVTSCLISATVAFNAPSLQLLHTEVSALFDLLPLRGNDTALRKTRRYTTVLTTLGWIFIALRWVAMLNLLDNAEPEENYLIHFQAPPPPRYSAAASTAAVALQWSMEIFFVTGILVFVPIYFMGLCLIQAEAFRQHNAAIADCGSATASEFSRARRLHERLCGTVAATDKVFGVALFLWCLLIIFSACLDLTQLFTDDNLLRDMARDDLFYFILRGVYSVLTAARVSEEAHAALPAVHALTLRHSHLTLDAKVEAQLLISRLTAPHVGLTAWNFFDVDRHFILNITAAVTTYMVIVIQLNPKAVKAINKLVTQALNTTTPSASNGTAEG